MLPPIQTFQSRFGSVRLFLAPMAGITDTVFRTLMRELGAEIVISELISSEGLIRRGKKTWELLAFQEAERPVGIQIFGHDIQSMAEAAKVVEAEGADFVNINFGCPVKKVVCDGGGAAWLRDPIQLGKLLTSVKKGLSIPLTIKIRSGWDETSKNAMDVVRVAADCGVSWVAIHGRTRAQGYAGLSDWELIREIAQQSPIPIIGNGDLITASHAIEKLERGYAHAIMIGRGALKNPWIFQQILGRAPNRFDFSTLVDRHFTLAIEKQGPRAFLSLKKFLAWYATGYPGASNFRGQLFQTEGVDELKAIALNYFDQIAGFIKQDDGQPFLMGGHG